MSIIFKDRMGHTRVLDSFEGETIESVLNRNYIPISSIITTLDNEPITERCVIDSDKEYIIKLIEGYDIDSIISSVFDSDNSYSNYVKKRVIFDIDGTLLSEVVPMNCEEVSSMVEDNIKFAIQNYNMIDKGDVVLVGLSGGVDSSSLIIALSKLAKELDFSIVAATFEDFDSLSSPAFANAKKLAKDLGIKHTLIPSDIIEKAFNLVKPLRQILPEMMSTKYNHYAMYADHHTTRRALELYCDNIGADKIILGLHTTDLIAGLLNSYVTGYQMSNMFKRQVGNYTYIYPLMFVPKKELHIYYYFHKNKYAVHSYPNAWEVNPKDRNYYYYLADCMQDMFPCIENYLYEAHSKLIQRETGTYFTKCCNCGSHILQQDYSPINSELCDVCIAFNELGYIKNEN